MVRMKVIKAINFTDIVGPRVGNFLDEYFSEKGWELQYVQGYDGAEGYQVFFGKGVQVDNNYEYGFPFLYDLDEVKNFAESFYFRKSIEYRFGRICNTTRMCSDLDDYI